MGGINRKNIIQQFVLKHSETYPVPYSLKFFKYAEEEIKKYYQLSKNKDLYKYIKNYTKEISIGSDNFNIINGENEFYRDIYDIIWKKDKGCITRGQVFKSPLAEPTLNNYKYPDFENKKYYASLKKDTEDNKDIFLSVYIDGIFERSAFLRGHENLLLDFYYNPLFVEELFLNQFECDILQIEGICNYNIDAIFFSDDIASQKGLLFSLFHWKKYIKLKMKKLVSLIHKKGKYAFYHSDGNIEEIIPHLIEIGIDLINPFQAETMDCFRLKKEYGMDISFYGGIPSQSILPFSESHEVTAEVKNRINKLGAGSSYIAGTGIEPAPGTPVKNLIALIEALRNQDF